MLWHRHLFFFLLLLANTALQVNADTALQMNKPLLPSDLSMTYPLHLNCDPCIRRNDFRVRAILHGTYADPFWQSTTLAMEQAARDFRIQLEITLYDEYDPAQMARDIQSLLAADKQKLPDGLIVTIPSSEVHQAIRTVAKVIPTFGFNAGYDQFEALGVLNFVAQPEYQAGIVAAQEFVRMRMANAMAQQQVQEETDLLLEQASNNSSATATATPSTPQKSAATAIAITSALFVNHQKGVQALEDRFSGYKDTLLDIFPDMSVQELVVHFHNNTDNNMDTAIDNAMNGCPYDFVLAAGTLTVDYLLEALHRHNCTNHTQLATYDLEPSFQLPLLQSQLQFALVQQPFLQATLPVLMATIYASTGNKLVLPLVARTYQAGPVVVNATHLLPDTILKCELKAFPICLPNENTDDTTTTTTGQRRHLRILEEEKEKDVATTTTTSSTSSTCDCTDRRKIRIGGVLHGHVKDTFWDPIFLAAETAASDMGIELQLDRLPAPPEGEWQLIHTQMAAQIKSLCESGVDGIFVTIPESDAIFEAIHICQLLNINVVAVNSDPKVSERIGVVHHIGQDEYGAGYVAGKEMIQAGVTEGYCLTQEGNSGVAARCAGFLDALAEQGDGSRGTEVLSPIDINALFEFYFEEAVGRDDDWDGVGLLVGQNLEPALQLKREKHPEMVIGTFDVGSFADVIFQALDEGDLLFTSDQQPLLQGNLPIYLLTYMAYTQQRLLDKIILTGPSLIKKRPSDAQLLCEANMWEVCASIPQEDFGFISSFWLGVGYFFVALTAGLGFVCLVWLYYYRDAPVVRASQPPFLALLAIGAVVASCAILPMGVETEYRELTDPFTGEVTGTNPDIGQVDAACKSKYCCRFLQISPAFSYPNNACY